MIGKDRCTRVVRFRRMSQKERLRHIWDYGRGWIFAAAAVVILLLVTLPQIDSRQTLGVCMAQSAVYEKTCTLVEEALQNANILDRKIETNALVGGTELDEKTQLVVAIAADEADCVICRSELMLELAQDGLLQMQLDGAYGIKIDWEIFNAEKAAFYLCVLKNADEVTAAVLYDFVRKSQ